jgi:hypothetical protein
MPFDCDLILRQSGARFFEAQRKMPSPENDKRYLTTKAAGRANKRFDPLT